MKHEFPMQLNNNKLIIKKARNQKSQKAKKPQQRSIGDLITVILFYPEESSNEKQKTKKKTCNNKWFCHLCITHNLGSVGSAPFNSGSILLASLFSLHAEKILRFEEETKTNRQALKTERLGFL
jgi:hypothetical protein